MLRTRMSSAYATRAISTVTRPIPVIGANRPNSASEGIV